MKKYFYSLGLIGALLLCPAAQAVVQIFTVPAAAVPQTNFFTLSSRIQSITIATSAGSGANLTYALVDQPTNNPSLGWGPLKQTNEAYVQVSQYLTNITKITTNFSGVTYTNIFTNAVFSFTNTVPKGSNYWRRLALGTVSSNGGSVTLTGPLTVVYGLGITNLDTGGAFTVTVDYDPSL